uniref:PTS system glucitol/sorbitol-specific IIA component n=1 Tax=Myoviridae sp. ctx322 TaxID=2826711 RepID=A0A8S5NBA4_9CAUD|nr:MAG TPA: PTS system glucitol/sorbitol-specific IIA component [Myoviridae sp. ctx322]
MKVIPDILIGDIMVIDGVEFFATFVGQILGCKVV